MNGNLYHIVSSIYSACLIIVLLVRLCIMYDHYMILFNLFIHCLNSQVALLKVFIVPVFGRDLVALIMLILD